MVTFRKSLETWEKELINANVRKYDRICIACATKRAIRMIKRFEQGISANNLYKKHRYYIVLTIKHTKEDNLEDLLNKLMQWKSHLTRNFRNSKRKTQRNKSFFHYFDGMVISIEVSHKWSNGQHPHINILACSDDEIPIEKGKYYRWNTNEQLKQERLHITWDSYVHNIRKIDVQWNYFSRSEIREVFKYAMKFSDLTIPHLAGVMDLQYKNKYRFFSTYGIFRWWDNVKYQRKGWGNRKIGQFLFDETKDEYHLAP
jgi:hypothetical protein